MKFPKNIRVLGKTLPSAVLAIIVMAGANPFSAVTGFLFLPSTQYSVVFILLALMVSIILYKFVFKSSKTGENNPSQNNPSESSSETNGPTGI